MLFNTPEIGGKLCLVLSVHMGAIPSICEWQNQKEEDSPEVESGC